MNGTMRDWRHLADSDWKSRKDWTQFEFDNYIAILESELMRLREEASRRDSWRLARGWRRSCEELENRIWFERQWWDKKCRGAAEDSFPFRHQMFWVKHG